MIPLHDDNPTERFAFLTVILIAINAAVFFLWQVGGVGMEQSIRLAGFTPSDFRAGGYVAEGRNIFTSMFMHGGLMHLVGNMWFLWLFGNNIEDRCGKFRFVVFYLLCGAIATMVYTLFNAGSKIPLVGASGAISGVLGAYLVTYPHARILTLVPLGIFSRTFRLPAWMFLFVWIGFQLLNQAAMAASREGERGGVAFLAHIAGFIAGVTLIFPFRRPRKAQLRRHRMWSPGDQEDR